VPTDEDLALLASYDWPGNVRELGAVIERAAILGHGKKLETAAALGAGARSGATRTSTAQAAPMRPSPAPAAPLDPHAIDTLDEAMRRHIALALEATRGRIEGPRGCAAVLGINPHTLRSRMRKLGVKWDAFRER
jgi:DNA-binding NtrC family response regulator